MRRATRILVLGLFGLAGTALTATTAAAQDVTETTRRGGGKVSDTRERRLVGTIEDIDRETREVTLRDEHRKKQTFTVPSAFTGFDQLKVGDRVNVTYTESVALSMGKPGEKAGVELRDQASQTPGAKRPSGTRVHEVRATAEIVSVDTAKNQITIKGPQGNTETVSVEDPQLRERLTSIKPGDTIELTYTQAIAGSITPAKKKER
jgi:hypothetical protein